MKRSYSIRGKIYFAALTMVLTLVLQNAFAESVESLKLKEETSAAAAIEAASQAKAAALSAAAAVKSAQDASKQAAEFANRAENLAYDTYLTSMARQRMDAVEKLPAPPEPPQVALAGTNPIDRFIMSKWPESATQNLCDDNTFIRRVSLDVLGIIPSATEVEAFATDPRPNKRAEWVDKILARNEDYATHWIQFWEDALCSNGNHQGGVGTHANFRDYIFESFKENKPFDIFTAQLLDPASAKYRGGYVRSETPHDSLLTAANVGQVFLGSKMKCATCHDDFLNFEWTQKRFYGFAAFFSPTDIELVRCEVKQGITAGPAPVFNSGYIDPEHLGDLNSRLHQVTRNIIDPSNPRYAAAFVNRLWKRYIGMGLVEPVDEFREDTPPSHPELLQWLAYEFVSHDYDVKHMIRLMLNSQTYQQVYNPQLADTYEEGKTLARYFRSPTLKKLTCEQFIDSLSLALGELKQRISFDETTSALTLALGRPATRNEVQTLRSSDVAAILALEYLNGPDLHQLVYKSPLPQKLASDAHPDEAVDSAFLAMLSRRPTAQEKQFTLDYFGQEINEDEWSDILWTLVVSPEFQYLK